MNIISLSPSAKKIDAQVSITGSKSYSNRALIINALCEKKCVLKNLSPSDDTVLLIKSLEKIKTSNPIKINVRNSGTVMRFLTAFCATLEDKEVELHGSTRMHERPIKELIDSLKKLGADITYLEKKGFPPLRINGKKLKGGKIILDGNISSQFLSAILLIAPTFDEKVEIEIKNNLVSTSYIDMTLNIMKDFGINIKNQNYKNFIIEKNQKYVSRTYNIETDLSGASYFLGIAAISGGKITIDNINSNSCQGDLEFPSLLKKMGCNLIKEKKSITIQGPKKLKAITANMQNLPDTAQTLAVVAAFAEGKTHLTGLSTLKNKETNRLEALQNELQRIGIRTEITKDSIIIYGGEPKHAKIKTYDDHRMAMAFAMAGSKIDIEIEEPQVVMKSFPDFWEKISEINMNIHAQKIILTGFMGTGKTETAKRLKKETGLPVFEMDELVLKKSGEKTIVDIFKKHGEKYFRELEKKVAQDLSKKTGGIISTGGGVGINEEILNLLKKNNGKVVFLRTKFETIKKRLNEKINRPLFQNSEEAKKLFDKRAPKYEKLCDEIIDTESKIHPLQKCIVIGDPIDHSFSPLIHNAGYKKLSIDKEFTYSKKRVLPAKLESFMTQVRTSNIRGISITAPHKTEVMKYLDETAKDAKKIGAVNTVINKNGILKGYNSDWIGIIEPLENLINLKGRKIAILGAGGSARSAIFGCQKKGATVKIFNRTIEKAKKISQEFKCEYAGLENLEDLENFDVVINTTSSKTLFFPKKFFTFGQIVMDINYPQTLFLKDAKSVGCRIIDGTEMLIAQAVVQFKLYTNQKIDKDFFKAIIKTT